MRAPIFRSTAAKRTATASVPAAAWKQTDAAWQQRFQLAQLSKFLSHKQNTKQRAGSPVGDLAASSSLGMAASAACETQEGAS
jgi:hypothetical protein